MKVSKKSLHPGERYGKNEGIARGNFSSHGKVFIENSKDYTPLEGNFIKTTDHRPTDHQPTDPPTIFHLPTDLPTHRPLTHRPTDRSSSTCIKTEDQILNMFCNL